VPLKLHSAVVETRFFEKVVVWSSSRSLSSHWTSSEWMENASTLASQQTHAIIVSDRALIPSGVISWDMCDIV